ncbi:valine--pyruvate transaminase [Plesiomonas shigelloides]|uniref:valine--pyruvate transaminase n=1 Tax=Plesiomonas shigelloides TaxID=703 RepID=UPI00224549AF|nr:valine--pyruvate transaminase [Plesiomonas shigelloides]MCX2532667.1 valine--pyruvate transaminase [Plesiomonas shigelloides]
MNWSLFGDKFTRQAGITQLMDDLNDGLRTPGAIMLGGGNPARIPQMQDYFTERCRHLLDSGELTDALCNYDGPQGKDSFLHALAAWLQQQFGWPLTAEHIALTNGSQSAFFYLFNLLAGPNAAGQQKQILFPLAPEYLGYTDGGLQDAQFLAHRPLIEELDDGFFKYHIDFDTLPLGEDIGLICVSRPTNPTGNVLTDQEITRLDELARAHRIPLLIDNAYGLPFPGIIFNEAKPHWNDNTILCMSLSKLGLPGLRCGIVIAHPRIIRAIGNLNGIISLAPGSVGPALALDMLRRGDLLRLSEQVVRPFYQQRLSQTLAILRRYLPASRCKIHQPEGALFLWLWFAGLPISTQTLYERLKARGVLVVPGCHFFTGLAQPWRHADECIRMNYVPEPELIEQGVKILAEEIERAWQEAGAAQPLSK